MTFAPATRTGWRFPIASFDAVVCLRVLMHTPDWRQSLGELCRVARDRVVFDYPALASAAALQAVTRRVAHAAGARVEAYRVFSDRAVRADAGGQRLSRRRHATASSCCRSRFHKRLGLGSGDRPHRRRAGARGAARGCSDRR